MSTETHLPATDFEPRDAPPKPLLIVGAGLAAGILVVLGLSLALYVGRYHDAPPLGTVGRQTSFHHSPDATTDIAADWRRADAEFQQHLGTYAWVDRRAGIVRIPIERAMERLVEERRASQHHTP